MEPLTRRLLLIVIASLILVKMLLAVLTPVSYDVVFYLNPPKVPLLPVWRTLFKAIFDVWMWLPIPHPDINNAWRTQSLLFDPSLHLLIFMVKSPLLAADFLVGFLLYRFSKRISNLQSSALVVSLAWFANPYSTFAVEMYASLDILPTLLVLATLLLLQSRRPVLASLSLAVATALKLYGIILTPLIALGGLKLGSGRARTALQLLLPIAGLAYYLYGLTTNGKLATRYLLEATPVTTTMTEFVLGRGSGLGYGQGAFIGLSTMAVILTYLILLEFFPAKLGDAYVAPLLILLAYLAFLDFQPGYMLWPLPLLTMLIVAKKKTLVPVLATYLSAFLLAFILNDGFLTPSGYSLLFFKLSGDPASWVRWLLEGAYIDVVLKPVLRSFISGFILVTMLTVLPNDLKHGKPERR